MCVKVLFNVIGLFLTIVAVAIFPVTYFVTPWYAFFKFGDPLLLIVNYGGIILATILYYIGDRNNEPE